MFSRNIAFDDVETILKSGETIEEYPSDNPYPSKLLLGFIAKRPIHIVAAFDDNEKCCIIVTAYEPDKDLWAANFKNRKK